QAEDGIRDFHVTGVQTCALPISDLLDVGGESTGNDPGRVDSPPTSSRSAPCATRARPWATAASGSKKRPPSEKLSGVTLTMPMKIGRASCREGVAMGGGWEAWK